MIRNQEPLVHSRSRLIRRTVREVVPVILDINMLRRCSQRSLKDLVHVARQVIVWTPAANFYRGQSMNEVNGCVIKACVSTASAIPTGLTNVGQNQVASSALGIITLCYTWVNATPRTRFPNPKLNHPCVHLNRCPRLRHHVQ